jgi:hypothetical protein
LVDQYIDNLKPSRTTYSQERGIVIAGGGLKYFPSVWVNVNLIRHFGCTLPIQLWYLGDTEMDPYMKRLLEPLGVECIDARQVEKEHPSRILCGWELKLYATLHSPFAQVLFLDADNGVVCDPTYLFDCDEYQRHGAVFWPDYACWTLKPGVWRVFGMMDMAEPEVAEHERAFESGQYLIDKRRCDRELSLSLFYAEHSDFTFQHVYGDKECFHLGWRRLGSDYAMPSAGPGWNVHTIVQFDFRGQILFQHRCQDKWRLGGVVSYVGGTYFGHSTICMLFFRYVGGTYLLRTYLLEGIVECVLGWRAWRPTLRATLRTGCDPRKTVSYATSAISLKLIASKSMRG